MTSTQKLNILYGSLAACFIIAVFTLLFSSQNIGWDAGLCIKMTDNAYKHIPFNHYAHPKPQNLNEDESEFVTWWSPGQFAIPLLIQQCFGIKISVAIKILTVLCMLLSGLGIYKLFTQLIDRKNFTLHQQESAAIFTLLSLLFVATEPFFWENLFVYDGGGILMLAYCPWFIYWVIKIDRINISSLLILLVSAILGFFLKTAFTSILAGALLYLFLSKSISPDKSFVNQNFKKIALNAIYLGIIFVIYFLTVKLTFLSHNRNIADSSLGIRTQLRVLVYPVVAPLFGVFSLDFLDKTYQWILGAVFILPVYYIILKSKNISLLYKYLLIGFVASCICFYSFLYFLNVDVSYELRHYRIITILLIPALWLAFKEYSLGRYFIYVLTTALFLINICAFAIKLSEGVNKQKSVTLSGLPSKYPNELIKKIHALDNLKDKGRDIFYFKNDEPSIALEVRNNRVLTEDNFLNFHFNNQLKSASTLYFGYNSGEIYLVCPDDRFKQDSVTYLTKFDKYKKFEKIYQTAGYSIYKAIHSPF
ncbi:hypothetical protein HDF24_22690 [Mucilaginibacter sp. X4EP1]|uniref:hypothetical protein n=1 Tax=Mucilaginibacter sp. X4EP1 TaxID=2723092 RepID=UPI002168EC55|nr:hypothetical protein [Mucilaginibacter sp. X4EP1]MCS3816470.1 hypothetical protein [Mucilaginibacter sp. X4EP1]